MCLSGVSISYRHRSFASTTMLFELRTKNWYVLTLDSFFLPGPRIHYWYRGSCRTLKRESLFPESPLQTMVADTRHLPLMKGLKISHPLNLNLREQRRRRLYGVNIGFELRRPANPWMMILKSGLVSAVGSVIVYFPLPLSTGRTYYPCNNITGKWTSQLHHIQQIAYTLHNYLNLFHQWVYTSPYTLSLSLPLWMGIWN